MYEKYKRAKANCCVMFKVGGIRTSKVERRRLRSALMSLRWHCGVFPADTLFSCISPENQMVNISFFVIQISLVEIVDTFKSQPKPQPPTHGRWPRGLTTHMHCNWGSLRVNHQMSSQTPHYATTSKDSIKELEHMSV